MKIEDIEKLAAWTAPKELQTKYGPRIFRRADVTPAFSAEWRLHKDEIKSLGANFSKTREGAWELAWWQELPAEIKVARAESVAASRATSAEIDLPHPEGLDYMPFQKAGIRFGLMHRNVLIADSMGLGKTVETIGILNADPAIKSAIIICPKSLKLNWQRELARWLTRPLSVGVVDGRWVSTDIVVINYEGLIKWSDQIDARTWGACIIDECHLIKSKKAQRSIYAKAVKCERRIRLTGTPIVNRPAELWNLIEDMAPEQFGNFWAFAKRYANAQSNGFGWDFSGASNLDELQRRLRETLMIRRLKSEVLTELPRKIRQIVEIEAETAQQRAAIRRESSYESENDSRMAELRVEVELSKADGEEAYRAAVERLSAANQVGFAEMAKLRHDTAVSKIPAVTEHVRAALEDNDNKIVVFVHHHDVADALMRNLDEFRPVLLMGGTSEINRQSAVDTFQRDANCRVFIGGIQAAGVGITLTAASHVVFAELDWVPGNVTQSEDRCHRIGQTETVLVQHIVLADSLDARMAKMLIEKQSVIDQALDVAHPERTREVYQPREKSATATSGVAEIEKEALTLTEAQVSEVLEKLRILASMDDDMAAERNGAGYNKIDTRIGHALAMCEHLTPRQAALGLKIVRKYARQVGKVSWESEGK